MHPSTFRHKNQNNPCCEDLIQFSDDIFDAKSGYKRFGYALDNGNHEDAEGELPDSLVTLHLVFETSASIDSISGVHTDGTRLFNTARSDIQGFRLRQLTDTTSKSAFRYDALPNRSLPRPKGVRSGMKLRRGARFHVVLEMTRKTRSWYLDALSCLFPESGPSDTYWNGPHLEIKNTVLEPSF